jgi:hypothetical protein
MLLKVCIPVEAGNKAIRDGLLPKTVMSFVEQMKPEAVYFHAEHGKRTALFFFDLKDPTMIPTVAEPFFMNLNATIELSPVMTLEEMKVGVDKALRDLRR